MIRAGLYSSYAKGSRNLEVIHLVSQLDVVQAGCVCSVQSRRAFVVERLSNCEVSQ